MTARQTGEIYELPEHGGRRFFMQLMAIDASQLGSHVLRVFEGVDDDRVVIEDVAAFQTAFFTHAFLEAGETLKFWRKVGAAPMRERPNLPIWRTCSAKEMRMPVASHWHIWATNSERQRVDPDSTLLNDTEIGMVMAPALIVERAHTGRWSMVCPRIGTA